jgi:hypothetical protein
VIDNSRLRRRGKDTAPLYLDFGLGSSLNTDALVVSATRAQVGMIVTPKFSLLNANEGSWIVPLGIVH